MRNHDAFLSSAADRWTFDRFWSECSEIVFVRSSKVRANHLHQGTLPRDCHTLRTASADKAPCASCHELTNDLSLKLYSVVRSHADDPTFDPVGYVITAAPDRAMDIIRERMSRIAGVSKPERTVKAKWIEDALPDARQRSLLALMLHYVCSNDLPERTPWPVERFANRLALDPDLVEAWVESVPATLAALGSHRAAWVDEHLLEPLGCRLTTDATAGDPWPAIDLPILTGRSQVSSTVEDALVEDEEARTVQAFLATARRLHAEGATHLEALRRAADEHLDRKVARWLGASAADDGDADDERISEADLAAVAARLLAGPDEEVA